METAFDSLALGLVSGSSAAKSVPSGGPERAGILVGTMRKPVSFAGQFPSRAPLAIWHQHGAPSNVKENQLRNLLDDLSQGPRAV